VLRIRIGFKVDPNTNPDPAFFVNANADLDRIQTQGFDDQKLEKIYS
jgi:hypothetical protein